jgi:hypothetical protein
VASAGGTVTYIGALIVLRLGYYWKGREMKAGKCVAGRECLLTWEHSVKCKVWVLKTVRLEIQDFRAVTLFLLVNT